MKLRILFGLLLFPVVALAEDARFRVSVESGFFLKKLPEPVSSNQGLFEAELERSWEISSSWQFKLQPVVRGQLAPEASEQNWVFDPREVTLGWTGESSFLRVGGFTPLWEGTDGVNPMDIATAKDWSDPVRSKSLASLGMILGTSGESFDLEAFWVPKQTKSILPGEKSPWLPRRASLPLREENVELRLPDGVEYEYLSRREIDGALENNVGLRFQYRTSFADFALAGFEGAAETPLIAVPVADLTPIELSPKEIFELQSPVRLQAVDYRRRSAAALISVPWESWIFRLSGRHDQPIGDDESLPGWSQQSIFGVEKTFSVGNDSVVAVLQGAWGRRAESESLLTVSDLFDRAALAGLRWPIGENWLIFLSGFASLKDDSSYGSLEITRRFGDSLSADLYYQNLAGPEESLIGLLQDRDRVGLRFTSNF